MRTARVVTDPCLACGHVEQVADVRSTGVCAGCGVTARCPPSTEFPVAVKRLLTRRLLDQWLAQHGGPDVAWPHLLVMAFRNSTVEIPGRGSRFIDYAASADELYGLALSLAERPDRSPLPRET
jgi:hypothetical protein